MKLKQGRNGVSPVIGVILMITITIVISAVVGTIILSLTPTPTHEVGENDENDETRDATEQRPTVERTYQFPDIPSTSETAIYSLIFIFTYIMYAYTSEVSSAVKTASSSVSGILHTTADGVHPNRGGISKTDAARTLYEDGHISLEEFESMMEDIIDEENRSLDRYKSNR